MLLGHKQVRGTHQLAPGAFQDIILGYRHSSSEHPNMMGTCLELSPGDQVRALTLLRLFLNPSLIACC